MQRQISLHTDILYIGLHISLAVPRLRQKLDQRRISLSTVRTNAIRSKGHLGRPNVNVLLSNITFSLPMMSRDLSVVESRSQRVDTTDFGVSSFLVEFHHRGGPFNADLGWVVNDSVNNYT